MREDKLEITGPDLRGQRGHLPWVLQEAPNWVSRSAAKRPSPVLSTCPVVSCPNGWVGYQEKCYYFAKAEGSWTSSKKYCSSLNATLAVVDSQEEMDFMLRYKGPADHWIGLQRNGSQPWKWINGTIFNEWFAVLGGGSCAYMNQQGIASSSCLREEPWICIKPVER
ncbi:C-type lectin domain family 2 member D-like [Heteronotia binoei]|uniref:C-type lectin domain family 2 member D-like n=1 Tax=Heteronotia binoei TaxID=13085 RepID=UPI00293016C4|nr:C-type lectin domain family 2 member D-like [Heteronotia binoei]